MQQIPNGGHEANLVRNDVAPVHPWDGPIKRGQLGRAAKSNNSAMLIYQSTLPCPRKLPTIEKGLDVSEACPGLHSFLEKRRQGRGAPNLAFRKGRKGSSQESEIVEQRRQGSMTGILTARCFLAPRDVSRCSCSVSVFAAITSCCCTSTSACMWMWSDVQVRFLFRPRPPSMASPPLDSSSLAAATSSGPTIEGWLTTRSV
ncbi:hypothetical protein B0T14DRAFT_287616 [Immersiella caudata]|uniref:Uncharacterized protein n=1 Tax=Immersiella caudata TaxID=314043 RepID=A0AA39WEB3_9PEZI|nr:hypothetical protein B0T14DRAFT_287616 [Immersiella caudata]